jgi:predicted ATPase
LQGPGEQTFPVLPLPVPDRTAGIEELSRSTAVQLFIERAKLHRPGFDLTEKDAPAVAELVGRLDGIPLALELAAARMRSLSVADINNRLHDRFKLLTGGGRVLLPRQQTLRTLVDWSYDLLQESERLLLSRLCVFVGGFDLGAAEGVCGADPLQSEDVLDVLSSLVEKSLVMADDATDRSRYRLLETIRDYAREKLIERGELSKLQTTHCDHYLGVAKAANRGLQGPQQGEWTRRVEADLDNIRAGIALALQGGVDPILAVKFAVALLGFWMLRGYATEGRNYVRAALTLPAVQQSDLAHAHALYVGAGLADSQSGHAEARRMLERCLKLRRGLGNPLDIAAALSTLSLVRLHLGDAAGAREGEAEAVDIFREVGNRVGEAIGLLHLAEIGLYTGDDAQAKKHVLDALEIARDIENMEIESECERMLGELALESGDVNVATERFARSLNVCRKAEDKRGEATALWWQGKADLAAGRKDLAWMRLSGALRAFQAFEMYAEMLGCLEDVADFLHVRDIPTDATRFYAAVERLRDRLVLPLPPRFDARRKERLALLRSVLGDAAFEAAWADGRPWGIEKSIRRALSLSASEAVAA